MAAIGSGITFATIAAYASAFASIASIGFGIYSSMAQAQQQQDVARAQSRQLENQARQREIEAQIAKENSMFEAGQARRRAVIALGKQSAIFAAAGIDPTSGSPLAMEVDQVKQMEMEALNIERGGVNTARSIQASAASTQFEANIAKYRASLAKGILPFEIANVITQGVGGLSSSYLSYATTQRQRVPRKQSVIGSFYDQGV